MKQILPVPSRVLYCVLVFKLLLFSLNDLPAQVQPIQAGFQSNLPIIQDSLFSCGDSLLHQGYVVNAGEEAVDFSVAIDPWFWDDFEEGLDKWVWDGSWGISTNAFDGEGALSDSPDGNYGNGLLQYIEMKNEVSVSNPDNCGLSYYLYTNTECGYDFLYTYLQVNGGEWIWLGEKDCYQNYTYTYHNLSGQVESGDRIKIRFEFVSDGSISADGIHLDEVFINGVYNPAAWFSVTPTEGSLNPGDSAWFMFRVSGEGIPAGSYSTYYLIESSQVSYPVVYGEAALWLTGLPALAVGSGQLDFQAAPMGSTASLPLLISNTGCDSLQVDSLVTDSPHFFALAQAFLLPPYEDSLVEVYFNPKATGLLTANLHLYTNGGEALLNLTGEGLPAPELITNPGTFDIQFSSCTDSIVLPLTIYNPGLETLIGKLRFTGLQVDPSCRPMSLDPYDETGIYHVGLNTIDHYSPGSSEGYVDLTDSVYTTLTPGERYDLSVETMYGDASLGAWIDYNNDGLFNMENERVLEHHTVMPESPLEFTKTERIRIPYSCIQATFLRLRVGSNYWGNPCFPCEDTWGQFEDYAVMVNPCIQLYADSIVVLPGDSMQLNISFSARNLPEGTHHTAIQIISNDPARPDFYLPVNLQVQGAGQISTTETNFVFPALPEHSVLTDTLHLYNQACGNIHINQITTGLPVFQPAEQQAIISGYDSLYLLIHFKPSNPGFYQDTLRLHTNLGLFTFPLSGLGIEAPHLDLFPDSVTVDMNGCGDTLTRGVMMRNPGSDTLYYAINQTFDFFEDFEDSLVGWTHQVMGQDSLWHTSALKSHGGSQSLWCGVEFLGTYNLGRIINNAIVTPYIDLRQVPEYSDVTFGFWQNYNTQAWSDLCKVHISSDSGLNWNWLNGSGYSGSSDGWEQQNIDLYHYAGKVIQIRFYFYTNATNNSYPGWFIDDLSITTNYGSQDWLSVNPTEGFIAPGDSSELTLGIWNSEVNSGDHFTFLNISSNAPAHPDLALPCHLHTQGAADVAHPNPLVMPTVMLHWKVDTAFYIKNIGCDTLQGVFSGEGLEALELWPWSVLLLPGDSLEVYLEFIPPVLGEYHDTLLLESSDGNFLIPVQGHTTPPPELVYSPDHFVVNTTSCSDSVHLLLSLSNTGMVNLDWTSSVLFNPVHYAILFNGSTAYVQMPMITHGPQWTLECWARPDSLYSGRKTIFGGAGDCRNWALCLEDGIYSLMIKPTTGACFDIISSGIQAVPGTWAHLAATCDGDSAWIYVDGILRGADIVSDDYPGFHYLFIGKEYNTSGHHYHGAVDEARLWDYPRTAGQINADKYRALSGNEPGLSGCWDMNETGVWVRDKSPYARHAGLFASRYLSDCPVERYLVVNPSSGTLLPGGSSTATVTVASSYLNSGLTSTPIRLQTNDPLQTWVSIPVDITVSGDPIIETSEQCMDFGEVMQLRSRVDTLRVFNRGCDTLFLTGSYTLGGCFSVDPPITQVLPKSEAQLLVNFQPPLSVLAFDTLCSDTLYIPNNDSLVKICLTGKGTPAPQIAYTPDSLVYTLACPMQAMAQLYILNEGRSALHYQQPELHTDWCHVDGHDGSLPPGDSLFLPVYFSRKGISPGTYQDVLIVQSDDPQQAITSIPIKLEVLFDDLSVALGPDTGLCQGASLLLDAGEGYQNYFWSNGAVMQQITVQQSAIYAVSVEDIHGCYYADSINVIFHQPPGIALPSDTLLCSGLTHRIGTTVVSNYPDIPQEVQIGFTNTHSSQAGPTPFGTSFADDRTQMLYLASELQAAGLSPGILNRISFRVSYTGYPAMTDFHLKLGLTEVDHLSGFTEGLEVHYYQASFEPTPAWNHFELSKPLYWDGNQNLIVEVCFNNHQYYNASAVQVSYAPDKVWSRYCDNCAPGCNLDGGSIFNQRPNIQIFSTGDRNVYGWTGPGNFTSSQKELLLTNFSAAQAGTYVYTVVNGNGCSQADSILIEHGTTPDLELSGPDTIGLGYSTQLSCSLLAGAPPFTYSWTPVEGLDDPTLANPIASPLVTTTYQLQVTGNDLCTAKDSVKINVLPLFALTGRLHYDNLVSTPLGGIPLTLKRYNGEVISTSSTGSNGEYSFPNLMAGTYSVEAAIDLPPGGINATDALEASRHIVQYITLSGAKWKAADVNLSGNISSADPLLILKRTVGLQDTFIAGDWTTYPITFSLSNQALLNDIKALCVGDVNASFIPGLKTAPGILLRQEGHTGILADGRLSLPLRLGQDLCIGALTLGLQFSDQVIQVEKLESPLEGINYYLDKDNKLWIAWQDYKGWRGKAGEALLSLNLRLKGWEEEPSACVALLPESEIADPQGTVLSPTWLVMPLPMREGIANDFSICLIPNPFRENTELHACFPEKGSLQVSLHDLTACLVSSCRYEIPGHGPIVIPLETEGLSPGLYTCRITYQGIARSYQYMTRIIKSK